MEKVEFRELPRIAPLELSNRPYHSKRTLKEGEIDLRLIVDERQISRGAWVYSPSMRLWFNVFSGMGKGATDINLDLGLNVIDLNYNTLGRDLRFYTHNHLALLNAYAEKYENEYKENMPEGNLDEEIEEEISNSCRTVAYLSTATPSFEDMLFFSRLYSRYPGTFYDFSVVSPYGKVSVLFDRFVSLDESPDGKVVVNFDNFVDPITRKKAIHSELIGKQKIKYKLPDGPRDVEKLDDFVSYFIDDLNDRLGSSGILFVNEKAR